MRYLRISAITLLVLGFLTVGYAQTFIWTGFGTGWLGQGSPPNDFSATLVFPNALRDRVILYGDTSLDKITLVGDNTLSFVPDSGASLPLTVTLANGLDYSISGNPDIGTGRYDFDANIDLLALGSQTFDVGGHTVILRGHLGGTDDITLKASLVSGTYGTFIFANTDTGNSGFSGNVTVDFSSTASAIAFWNTSPFGTGQVTFLKGGTLIAHGTQTVTNDLVLNPAGGTDALALRSWDDTLTFSGDVTLAGNVTIQPLSTPAFINFANGTGVLTAPGLGDRQPILFTGAIGESGGARSLSVLGSGVVILAPAAGPNTYTGGTVIGGTSVGTLIFGNNNAFGAGSNNVAINPNGYAGIADLSAGNFFTEANQHFVKSSGGGIGVDTLPGNPTVTFTEDINLSSTGAGALSFTNASARIGTATSAILTGNITPQGTNFIFGNGGGTLYVQSNLGNTTASGTTTRALNGNSAGPFPLKLFLQGTNTYTGGTLTGSSYIIFDGTSALPATGSLTAQGSSSTVGGSYLGYTGTTALTPAAFLARFDAANTWGIVGFDTHSGDATANIGAIDLTGFNNGVFLGTATSAVLSGAITGTTVLNTFNAPDTLRFTAANGGNLEVSSTLADGAGTQSVMLGAPGNVNQTFNSGTILLSGANTYSGGTTINAGSFGPIIVAGSNSAFGTGNITLNATASGMVAGLAAASAGLDLGNILIFAGASPTLHLMGDNALTLSGNISGTGIIQLQRSMDGQMGDARLAGDNSGFSGQINVQHSTLYLDNDYATGAAVLRLFSSDAEAVFESLNPHLAGIFADTGSVILSAGTNLTFDTWNTDWDFNFEGNITGVGGGAVNASITVDGGNSSDTQAVYLSGANTFTGGANVINNGILVLGSGQAAGSGTITVNSLQGGLGLNAGVTLTNPLVFTQGAIAGYGTFAPTSFNGVPGAPITIGTNQFIIPALPGLTGVVGGTLSVSGNMVFSNGGGYRWSLQDPTFTDGYGLVAISGALDLSSLSPGGFTIYLQSFDPDGLDGMASLTWGSSYNFTILTASGGIAGFNSNQFLFDVSDFQLGLIPSTQFSLAQSGSSLVLSFTAVPEPSTWALLSCGGLTVALQAGRRRWWRRA